MGIFKDTFIPTWVQNSSRIFVHHILALPLFLYGSKIWILKQKGKKIDINQDKIFQKNSSVHTFLPQNKLNFGRAESIAVDEKLRRYKSNWLQHVTRMNNKMSKIMLNYRPNGSRQLG
jgi:hypothetical protein